MLNNKTLKLFKKRAIKYFLILLIISAMAIPMLLTSYNLAQKQTIDKSSQKLDEGLLVLETQVKKAQGISNLLLKKIEYNRLSRVNGSPSAENFADIIEIQQMLGGLCLTQDNLSKAYILFKNNPIFISNFITSDDYFKVYPDFINYEQTTAQEWYDGIFLKNIAVRFIPAQKLYISYYSSNYINSLTCLINSSQYSFISPESILACVFDTDSIIDSMMYQDQQSQDFLYIKDNENKIILKHNYIGEAPLEAAAELTSTYIHSQRYVRLSSTSSQLGLEVVMGIPEELFQSSVHSLIRLLIIYCIAGTVIILLLSLLFSIKEAISVGQLVESASKSSKTVFSAHNEYSYIHDAIQQISSSNEEYLHKIDILNHSIKACVLENLFLYGIYTQKDEQEITSYFNKDFRYFSIAIFHFQVDEPGGFSQSLQQNIIFNLESEMRITVKNEFFSINISPHESVFLLFFDESDYCDISILESELAELIHRSGGKSLLPFTVNIGMSKITSGAKNVRQAYLQARDALHFNRSEDVGGVYVYNTPREISKRKVFDIAILQKCYDVILVGDKKLVEQIFCDIRQSMELLQLNDQDQLRAFFAFSQAVHNAYLEIKAGIQDKDAELLSSFPDYSPLEDMDMTYKKLMEVATDLCDIVSANRRSNNEKLKDSIIAFIQENYHDLNLSAELIGEKLLLSEKYIFSLVKEQTGKSLGRYIEDTRISHAEQFLTTSDKSNAEIIQVCGFGSVNTFYRAFSRKHGVPPTIWRKNNKK